MKRPILHHCGARRAGVMMTCAVTLFILLYTVRTSDFGTVKPPLPFTQPPGQVDRRPTSRDQAEAPRVADPSWEDGTPKPEHPALTETSSVQERFAQRKRLLDHACKLFRQDRGGGNRREEGRGGFQSIPNKLFYCGIEKTGSSEMTSLLHQLPKNTIYSHGSKMWPRALNRGDDDNDGDGDGEGDGHSHPNPFRDAGVRFFFVREPYGRLLSAYVDKIFSPNVIFWNKIGRHIVQEFRSRPSALSLRCGHDVTFAEFIDYVVDAERTGRKADGHFTPQFKHCHVCSFPYSHVGHLETLQEDRGYLFNLTRLHPHIPPSYPLTNLEHQVKWYIKDYKRYRRCISKEEALRRLWQKLKIRGHLDASQDFPLSPKQSQNVTVHEFLSIAGAAVRASQKLPSFVLQANRRRALKEAYDTVLLSKKRVLARLFRWDFELFGYDRYPPEVFGTDGGEGEGDGSEGKSTLFGLWSRNRSHNE
ncbi:uncharacterized protein LOC143297127 [Babylonia areolata]|uniref:uncharacterized protein LOC143297127 n=1 Tax=Babylonia areolata TaxID=304850 RepID=UPI003FD02942